MYHWVIGLGLLAGLAESVSGHGFIGPEAMRLMHAEEGYLHIGLAIVLFLGRVVGTCALFYGFFLCRMLGAGDIKLMAVCVGCLGIWTGALVIFCGMGLALAAAFLKGKVWKYGWRMIRGMEMRLAPYLFAGYCAVIVLGQSGLMDAV